MIVNGHRVYRGRRSLNTHAPTVLIVLLAVILLAVLTAFILLPEYIVFGQDRLRMVVPMLEEDGRGYTVEAFSGPAPYIGNAETVVQVAAPDYSNVNYTGRTRMNYLQGYYVPFSKANAAGVEGAAKEAQRRTINCLVIRMKDESGKLAWFSNVALASSLSTNSTWEPRELLTSMKAEGWRLVAEIPCCVDSALASGKPEVALRDAQGAVYADGAGSWVDPWNREVREYAADLAADLISLGFDEIILTRVEQPAGPVQYTRQVASGLDAVTCVTNFSIAVREALADTIAEHGTLLSAEISHAALTGTTANGQNLENFLKIFDRVVITTDTYSEDAKVFVEKKIDSTLRFVAKMEWGFSGCSWILSS